ncbi:hypothetical protein GLOIN_2v1880406 [Rhizophagus irregularis DAOM 181602=DAOM 197198]|nr:hypothetical protein RhiirB3_456588 [Rhizophagus irregularis]GET49921.1 hypothetical protein GLOIN_2v1880406 [Rhizophagus irregularis DAOM 181602=DAOM 197198]
MASKDDPKKTGVQWLANWSFHLEICLNNYQYSGTTLLNGSQSHLSASNHFMPKEIIVLKPEETLKFSYIVGWIIYKLTKMTIQQNHILNLKPFVLILRQNNRNFKIIAMA